MRLLVPEVIAAIVDTPRKILLQETGIWNLAVRGILPSLHLQEN